MSNLKNVVILNDSTMLHGYVRVKMFTLKTAYGSVNLKSSQISSIEYRSKSSNGKDMVSTSEGSTLFGDLLPAVLAVEVEGETLNIPKSDIHFVVLFIGRGEKISLKSKNALKKVGL